MDSLRRLHDDICECRTCPRLVRWREQVAADKRASFRDEEYWGRPVPGFGDAAAALWVVGLAPAAHGANRTGRMFTGDRSGDWLYRAMHRAGFANQEASTDVNDGLRLDGAWVSAAVRCAPPDNKPSNDERDSCAAFFSRERQLLTGVRCIVALGSFALAAVAREYGMRPRPRFGHGVETVAPAGGPTVVCSFHPSQQNTFTGKLTEPMLDAVFSRAREICGRG